MRSDAGFTLLETLYAAVLLGLLGILAMAMLSRTLRLTGELEPEIETIEFARSVLAEIEAFGPDFGLSGEYGQRFSYRVNFEETASSEPTRFDGVVDLVQATIEVTDRHSDHEPAQFVQIFAMTGGP